MAEQLDLHLHPDRAVSPAGRVGRADPLFLTEELWRAYQALEKDRVHGAGERRILADLVSLVRHAILEGDAALDEDLEPYAEGVLCRYEEWLVTQTASGRNFTPAQRWWLNEIARQIGINVSISLDALNYFDFQGHGGQVAAQRVFGAELVELIDELNTALGV